MPLTNIKTVFKYSQKESDIEGNGTTMGVKSTITFLVTQDQFVSLYSNVLKYGQNYPRSGKGSSLLIS